jgi:hypothetical protein
MIKIILFITILSLCSSQSSIPQVQPSNGLLNSLTNYTFSFYTNKGLILNSSFEIDFSLSQIQAPSGSIIVSASINDTAINNPTGSCSNQKCIIKLNQIAISSGWRISIIFGMILNPYYLFTQKVSTNIIFNPSINSLN